MDTFVEGLHRRTLDLHLEWAAEAGRSTAGPEARAKAVEEMLLRLRWDDRDPRARVKLSRIVALIWDDLEGAGPGMPLSSALWLHDDAPEGDARARAGEAASAAFEPPERRMSDLLGAAMARSGMGGSTQRSVSGDGEEWRVL